MRRSGRRKVREGAGLRRSVKDRKLVTAEVRAGRCPCGHTEIDNPGEHIPSCRLYGLDDATLGEELPF
jgi:hypothetical protein